MRSFCTSSFLTNSMLDSFQEIAVAGRGSLATAYLVRCWEDNRLYCMKKFHRKISQLSQEERKEVSQEISIMAKIVHPNIVKFYYSFIENDYIHIIMEYCWRSLKDEIHDRHGQLMDEDRIWEILVQLIAGLRYMHSCSIVHRDLSTKNVLCTGENARVVKLADFGLSQSLQASSTADSSRTPHMTAPEVLKGQGYSFKSEIFSLGLILFELMNLEPPFLGTNSAAIMYSITHFDHDALMSHISKDYSDDLKLLLCSFLDPDPMIRPSTEELESNPIISLHWAKWMAVRRSNRQLDVCPRYSGEHAELLSVTPTNEPRPRLFIEEFLLKFDFELRLLKERNGHRFSEIRGIIDKIFEELRSLSIWAWSGVVIREKVPESSNAYTYPIDLLNDALKSTKVYQLLGHIYYYHFEDFNKAMLAYDQAMRVDPTRCSLQCLQRYGIMLVTKAHQVWQCHLEETDEIASAEAEAACMTKKRDWFDYANEFMYQGLSTLERVNVESPSLESKLLLAFSYRTAAWTGLGIELDHALIASHKYFGDVYQADFEEGLSHIGVSAMLNQITIEVVRNGNLLQPSFISNTLAKLKESEEFISTILKIDPTDIWTKVQLAITKCIEFLIYPPETTQQVKFPPSPTSDEVLLLFSECFVEEAPPSLVTTVINFLRFLHDVCKNHNETKEGHLYLVLQRRTAGMLADLLLMRSAQAPRAATGSATSGLEMAAAMSSRSGGTASSSKMADERLSDFSSFSSDETRQRPSEPVSETQANPTSNSSENGRPPPTSTLTPSTGLTLSSVFSMNPFGRHTPAPFKFEISSRNTDLRRN
jgi:serine/threonine protein kinase